MEIESRSTGKLGNPVEVTSCGNVAISAVVMAGDEWRTKVVENVLLACALIVATSRMAIKQYFVMRICFPLHVD